MRKRPVKLNEEQEKDVDTFPKEEVKQREENK